MYYSFVLVSYPAGDICLYHEDRLHGNDINITLEEYGACTINGKPYTAKGLISFLRKMATEGHPEHIKEK